LLDARTGIATRGKSAARYFAGAGAGAGDGVDPAAEAGDVVALAGTGDGIAPPAGAAGVVTLTGADVLAAGFDASAP
jgi:hypothetical protein